MKAKHISILVGVLATAIAVFLSHPTLLGICIEYTNAGGTSCSAPFRYPYGVSLLPLASVFLGASIVMLVATGKTFSRWIKFSVGYAVVIAALLFAVPNIGYGMGGFGFTILDTQGLAILYATLYALISLILLAVSEFLERRKR